jgi:hypothetical protein
MMVCGRHFLQLANEQLFGITELGAGAWGQIVAVSFSLYPLVELEKTAERRQARAVAHPSP